MKHLFHIFAIIAGIIIIISDCVQAQDHHLSQYYVSPVTLNPSYTGMFKSDGMRVVSQYRKQWSAIGSNLSTTTLAVDEPYNERFGVGGYLLNSEGARYYNSFHLVASGAYRITYPKQTKYQLSVGLQAGIIINSIKPNRLLYDNQYFSGTFDPDLPSQEPVDDMRQSKVIPEVNMGIRYTHTDNTKVNPYAGFAISHITAPNEAFDNNGVISVRPRKYALHLGSKININEQVILDPRTLFLYQGNIYEIDLGVGGKYIITPMLNAMAAIHYRINDAIIIAAGCHYKNITYRMSYDITTSSLKEYNNGNGGIEFSIIFSNITFEKPQIYDTSRGVN